jgi:hypothetical protein
VPEQFLDRAQVRAPLEQVGGEGMAEGVRRDASREGRLADPALEPAADVGGVQPPAALRDQKGRFLSHTY